MHYVIDGFIIYCGEGRRHISVFSRVQSCLTYCLPTFELHRQLSGPGGNLIYCIKLVTLCIYNEVISLHILFNYCLLICTGFCSLSWRWRQSVPTCRQHGHNPEDNLRLVTHFNFSSVRAPNNHFPFDLTSVTKKYQGRENSI